MRCAVASLLAGTAWLVGLAFAAAGGAAAQSTGDLDTDAAAAAHIETCLKEKDDPLGEPGGACTKAYLADCSAAMGETTLAMNECAITAIGFWRAEVTARTKRILTNPHAGKELLETVQAGDTAFESYLEERCRFYRLFQGTIWGPMAGDCQLEMLTQRAGDLALIQRNAPGLDSDGD